MEPSLPLDPVSYHALILTCISQREARPGAPGNPSGSPSDALRSREKTAALPRETSRPRGCVQTCQQPRGSWAGGTQEASVCPGAAGASGRGTPPDYTQRPQAALGADLTHRTPPPRARPRRSVCPSWSAPPRGPQKRTHAPVTPPREQSLGRTAGPAGWSAHSLLPAESLPGPRGWGRPKDRPRLWPCGSLLSLPVW